MNDLENILKSQREDSPHFDASFTDAVMNKIRSITGQEIKVITLWQSRLWKIAAACFVGCLLSLYALDGSLSVDYVLGLSEYSDIEISQSYQNYSAWDIDIN